MDNDEYADWCADATQVIAICRSNDHGNGCNHRPAHQTRHGKHDGATIKYQARGGIDRIQHAQQGHGTE